MRWMAVSIVVAAIIPVASLASAQTDDMPGASANKTLDMDHFPTYQLSAGLVYSPAPLVLQSDSERESSSKMPDLMGGVVSFERRFSTYLLAGGQVSMLKSDAAYDLGVTARLGAMLPLSKRFALFGFVGLGVDRSEHTRADLADEYEGYHGWLGLGFRHFFTDAVGIEAQVSGFAGQGLGEFQDIVTFRMHLQVGIVFGM